MYEGEKLRIIFLVVFSICLLAGENEVERYILGEVGTVENAKSFYKTKELIMRPVYSWVTILKLDEIYFSYRVPYEGKGKKGILEVRKQVGKVESVKDKKIFKLENVEDLRISKFDSTSDYINFEIEYRRNGKVKRIGQRLYLKDNTIFTEKIIKANLEGANLSKGKIVYCQKLDENCGTLIEDKCNTCKHGYMIIIDKYCSGKWSKVCAPKGKKCGMKSMPACLRGIEIGGVALKENICVDGSVAGFCLQGLDLRCDQNKILSCF